MIDLTYRCPCGSVFADTRAGSAVGVHFQRWMAVHENHDGYCTLAFSIRDDEWDGLPAEGQADLNQSTSPTAPEQHSEGVA